jgi:hypothetical protein
MYTGDVVRLRSFAFIVALMLTASPVLALVCEMDCDHVTATPPCHHTENSGDGSSVRGSGHPCDHDHPIGTPALLASAIALDFGGTFVALPVRTLIHVSVTDPLVLNPVMHGPPGVTGRSVSSRTTVLRI